MANYLARDFVETSQQRLGHGAVLALENASLTPVASFLGRRAHYPTNTVAGSRKVEIAKTRRTRPQ